MSDKRQNELTFAFDGFLNEVQRILGLQCVIEMCVLDEFIKKMTAEAILYSPSLRLSTYEDSAPHCSFRDVKLTKIEK